jgi:hypothetical protein
MRETSLPSVRKERWLGPLKPLAPTVAVTTWSPSAEVIAVGVHVAWTPMFSPSLQRWISARPRELPAPVVDDAVGGERVQERFRR